MAEFDKVGVSVFLHIGTPLWENTQIHRSRSTSELNCQGIDPRNLTLCISTTFRWPRLQLEISRPDCLRFRFLKPHGNEVFCLVPWQHLATSVSSGSHHTQGSCSLSWTRVATLRGAGFPQPCIFRFKVFWFFSGRAAHVERKPRQENEVPSRFPNGGNHTFLQTENDEGDKATGQIIYVTCKSLSTIDQPTFGMTGLKVYVPQLTSVTTQWSQWSPCRGFDALLCLWQRTSPFSWRHDAYRGQGRGAQSG